MFQKSETKGQNLHLIKFFGFGVFTVLLIIVSIIAFITYTNQHMTCADPFMRLAIENNLGIMASLIIVSVGFGFLWSSISMKQAEKTQADSKSVMDIILHFLSKDELIILTHLLENEGTSTQAALSRLPGMTRVRAHRLTQKMKEKLIITVTPEGKKRIIRLKSHIYDLLTPQT